MLQYNDATDLEYTCVRTTLYDFIRTTHVIDFDIISTGFGEHFYMIFPCIWDVVDPSFTRFLSDMPESKATFEHALLQSVDSYNHQLSQSIALRARYAATGDPDWRSILQGIPFTWCMERQDAMLFRLIFTD